MKRAGVILVLTVFCAVPAWADLSWNYDHADGDGTSLTSPYSWATVDTFDGTRPGWGYVGNSIIYTGDVPGKASAPWSPLDGVKDNTPYLAVPGDNSTPDDGSSPPPFSVVVDFGGGAYDYLGLHWGSMDDYNQIQFLAGGSVVGQVTGDQVWISPPSGAQEDPGTNQYVNFFSTVDFDSVKLTSFGGFGGVSPYAFELDNLAVGVVPVPGAVLLGVLGLGTAGQMLRRKRRA